MILNSGLRGTQAMNQTPYVHLSTEKMFCHCKVQKYLQEYRARRRTIDILHEGTLLVSEAKPRGLEIMSERRLASDLGVPLLAFLLYL